MHDMQSFSPSMLAYPDPTEFDYNAFLQPPSDDMGLQHQQLVGQIPLPSPIQPSPTGGRIVSGFSDSSAGRATPPESDTRSTSHEIVRSSSALSTAAAAAGKHKLERRGHTKSRRGCYNCKRRRIKVRHGCPWN